ncbi:MAG: hypothetical protein ACO3JL_19150 [Myxococcota bacterium]
MTDRNQDRIEDSVPDDELGDARSAGERFAQRVIPDVVRRAIMTGVGAVLVGEEGIRSSLGEMKMPKEAMSYLVSQADKTKREVIHSLARELRGFLDSLDLQSLIEKAVAGTTIEIQTTVRVIPKEEGGVGLEVLKRDTAIAHDDEVRAKPRRRRRASKPVEQESDT